MGNHRWGRRAGPDLARQATTIASGLGLRVGEVLGVLPGVHRVVVEGPDLPRPAVLHVREGPGFPDTGPRRRIASEHLGETRELPQPAGRAHPICARLEEHLDGGDLRTRLESGPLRIGEVVTVLLAVLDVLHLAHHAGFGGVEPRADRIRFRADGCPVVTELPGCGPLTAERARTDTVAFLALVRELAQAIPEGAGAALVSGLDEAIAAGAGADGLREALLAAAPPVAVQPRVRGDGAPKMVAPQRAARERREHGSRPAMREPTPPRRGRAIVGGRRLRERWGAVAGFVGRRPKAILGAALVVVATVVALVALPAGSFGPSGPRAEPSPAPASDTPRRGPVGSRSSAAPGAEPDAEAECAPTDVFELTGGAGAGTGGAGAGTEGAQPARIAGGGACAAGSGGADDPAAPDTRGADAGVAHEAAGAAEAALEWLAARGTAAGYAGAQARITQRWGDAALVRVEPDPEEVPNSEPASLLLVRGEAGWRVRAVYS